METKVIHLPHRQGARRANWFLAGLLAFSLGLLAAYTFWTRAPRIVRGVSIADVPVSGLSVKQAREKLERELPPILESEIVVEHEGKSWATSSAALGLHRDYDAVLDEAIKLGRHSSVIAQQSIERAQLLAQPKNLSLPWEYQEAPVRSWAALIAKEVAVAGRAPSVKLSASSFKIDSGEAGFQLNEDELVNTLLADPGKLGPVAAPVEPTVIPLSADGLLWSQQRLAKLRPAKITLEISDNEPEIALDAAVFFPWVVLPDGWKTESIDAYVDDLAVRLDRDAMDAQFERDPDNERKLKKFRPQQDGRQLQRGDLALALIETLTKIESGKIEPEQKLTVAFKILPAEISLDELNDLGIRERLGIGNSTFFHSIPNRVSNVALTSQRLHATLVAPGEDFSFNRAVGEISRNTGYKPAYVISGGRTVLGDGGGVCQVSTTTFRAALNAGLPITKWKAHSYRVGYYEQNSQPGFDATVYSPSTDLSFRNDTGRYLVVATSVDIENRFLAVEIWGTSDGRKSEISGYRLYNQTGAPAPAYVPDPSLPKGTTKQIDFSAPGATAEFTYTVTDKAGQTSFQRTFVSRFQAWRAVYLVGTQ
jgi:vancomycin resistance protein YoaR